MDDEIYIVQTTHLGMFCPLHQIPPQYGLAQLEQSNFLAYLTRHTLRRLALHSYWLKEEMREMLDKDRKNHRQEQED